MNLKMLLALICLLIIQPVQAGTISIGRDIQLNLPDPGLVVLPSIGGEVLLLPSTPLELSLSTVNITGNLFLDYSVFGDSVGISIPEGVTLTAETITIYGFSQLPPMLGTEKIVFMQNLVWPVFMSGDVLMFSEVPIQSAAFSATQNIYIGNYSALRPVPLPASGLLLLSGLYGLRLFSSLQEKSLRMI